MSCTHREFQASVRVEILEDTGQFTADIQIHCTGCEMPFHFLGLPGGLAPDRPTISVDGREARMPIAPGVIRL